MGDTKQAPKPRDARTVEEILKSMGVESYDPRVVTQLLELEHRYISDVLRESHALTEFADKPAIDLEDVRLAIRSKCAFTFTQPPPREVTMRLAAERNAVPLPAIDQRAGVALPPPADQLTRQNYRVIASPKQADKTLRSSPKRPRLTSSPARPPSASGAHTPVKSPGSNRIAILRSAQSPSRLNVDSPAKQKTPDGRKSPGGSIVLPPAAGGLSSMQARSPGNIMSSPGKKKLAKAASPGRPPAAPDVIMIDPDPNPKTPVTGATASNSLPAVGSMATSPPKASPP